MSSEIDQRIVEMRFENGQFENGVRNSISSLEKLESALKFDTRADGFDQIQKSADRLNFSQVEQALDSIIHRYSTLGIIGARVVENLVDKAMAGISTVTAQLKSGGMNRALNLEQAKFTLKGLDVAWDESLQTGISKNINEAVKGTAYGLDAAAKAASQLVASNVEVGDSMYHALRGIAGVASMTNSTYDDISHIFTRIAGNGKMMGEDLMSFSARGLNAAATLGKVLGQTEAEIRELASDGAISFEIFSEAMYQAFGEQAAKANDTFNGAMSNVNAALSRIGAKFAAPYIEYMRPVLVELIGFFDAIGKSITPLVDKVSSTMKTLSDLTVNALKGITGQLVDLNDANKPVAESTNWVQPFAQGLANIIDGIRGAITLFHDFWEAAFPSVSGNPLLDFANSFREATSVFKYVFTGEIDAGSKAVKEFIEVIGDHTSVIEDFKATVTAVAEVVGTLYSKLKLVWDKILQPLAMRILPAILKYIRSIAEEASTIVKLIFGNGVFDTAVDVIGKGMTKLSDLVLSLFGATDKVSENIEDTARHTEKAISKTADNIEDTTGKAVDKSKEKLREYHKVVNDVINWDKDANGDWEQSLFDSGYTKEQIDEIKELVERVTNEGWEIFIDVDSNADEAAEELERLKELAESLYHTNNELVDKIYNETVDSVNSTFKSVAYADRSIDYMHDTFFDQFYDNLVNSGFDPEEARALATEHSKIFFDAYIDETEEAYNEKMQNALPEKTHGEEIREARDRMTGWTSDPRKVYNDRVNKAFDQAFDKINARYKDKVLSDIDIDKMTQEAFDESYQYLLKFGFTEEEAYDASLLNRKLYYDRFASISEEAWDEIRGNAKDTEEFGETVSIADRLGSALTFIVEKLRQAKTLLVDKIIKPAGGFLIKIGTTAWGTITDTVGKVAEWVGAIWDEFSQSDIIGQIGDKIEEIKGHLEPIVTNIRNKIQPFLDKLRNIKLPEVDPNVVERVSGALESIGTFFLNGLNGAQEKIGVVADKLKGFLEYNNDGSIDIWASIRKATDAFVQYIGEKVGEFKAYIASFFINPETKEFDIFKPLKDLGGEAIEFVTGKLSDLKAGFEGLIVTNEDGSIDYFSTFQNAGETAIGAVKGALEGFIATIKSLPGRVARSIDDALGMLLGYENATRPENREDEDPNARYFTMFEDGLSVIERIPSSLSSVFGDFDILGIFSDIEGTVSGALTSVQEFGQYIIGLPEKIKTAFEGFSISDTLTGISGFFESIFRTIGEKIGWDSESVTKFADTVNGLFTINPDTGKIGLFDSMRSILENVVSFLEDVFPPIKKLFDLFNGDNSVDTAVIEETMGTVADTIDTISEASADIEESIEENGGILETLGKVFDFLTGTQTVSAAEFVPAIEQTDDMTNAVETIATNVEQKKGLFDIVASIIDGVTTFLSTVVNTVTTAIPEIINGLSEIVTTIGPNVISLISEAFSVIGDIAGSVIGGISTVLSAVHDKWPEIQEFLKPFGNTLMEIGGKGIEKVGGFISGIADSITNVDDEAEGGGIGDVLSGAISTILDVAKTVFEKVKGIAQIIIDNASTYEKAAIALARIALVWEVVNFIKAIRLSLGGGYLTRGLGSITSLLSSVGSQLLQMAAGLAIIAGVAGVISDDETGELKKNIEFLFGIVLWVLAADFAKGFMTLVGKGMDMAAGNPLNAVVISLNNAGTTLLAIGAALLELLLAVKVYNKMGWDELGPGLLKVLAAVGTLSIGIAIITSVSSFVASASGFMSSLAGVPGTIIALGVGLLAIVGAISWMNNLIDKNSEKGDNSLTYAILSIVGALAAITAAVIAIETVSAGLGGIWTVVAVVAGIGVGLFALAKALETFQKLDVDFGAIGENIKKFFVVIGTAIAEGIKSGLKSLKSIFFGDEQSVEEIVNEGREAVGEIVGNYIDGINAGLDEVANQNAALENIDTKMTDLREQINKTLNIAETLDAVSGNGTHDYFERAINTINEVLNADGISIEDKLSVISNMLEQFTAEAIGFHGIDTFGDVDFLDADKLAEATKKEVKEGLDAIEQGVNEAIEENQPTINADIEPTYVANTNSSAPTSQKIASGLLDSIGISSDGSGNMMDSIYQLFNDTGMDISGIGVEGLAEGLGIFPDQLSNMLGSEGNGLMDGLSGIFGEMGVDDSILQDVYSSLEEMGISVGTGGADGFENGLMSVISQLGSFANGEEGGLGNLLTTMLTSMNNVGLTEEQIAAMSATYSYLGGEAGEVSTESFKQQLGGLIGSLSGAGYGSEMITHLIGPLLDGTIDEENWANLINTYVGMGTETGNAVFDEYMANVKSAITEKAETEGSISDALFGNTTESIDGTVPVQFKEVGSKIPEQAAEGIAENKGQVTTELDNLSMESESKLRGYLPVYRAIGNESTSELAGGIAEKQSESDDAANAIGSTASDKIKSYVPEWTNAGNNSALGFITAIRNNIDEVVKATQEFVNAHTSTMTNGLQEKSPSRVTGQIAAYSVQGFVNEIMNELPTVENASDQMVNSFLTGLDEAGRLTSQVLSDGFTLDPRIQPILDTASLQNGLGTVDGMFAQKSLAMAANANLEFKASQSSMFDMMKQIDPINYSEEFKALRTDINTLNDTLLKRPIVLDSGEIVGGISGLVDQSLGMTSMRRNRGL